MKKFCRLFGSRMRIVRVSEKTKIFFGYPALSWDFQTAPRKFNREIYCEKYSNRSD